MWRLTLWVLLAVAVLSLPASCVTALLVLNVANPMATTFLTSFEVSNASGEIVHITPIGTVGKAGRRHVLPFSVSAHLSIPSWTAHDFQLDLGEKQRFTYDWDDINFSEIAIRDERGH